MSQSKNDTLPNRHNTEKNVFQKCEVTDEQQACSVYFVCSLVYIGLLVYVYFEVRISRDDAERPPKEN